jgi:hypothetical protein
MSAAISSSLRSKNITMCVPAAHGANPIQRRTLVLPPSRGAQQLSFWYRRYLATREFSWMMKIEAAVHHSGVPELVPMMHVISDEVYSYQMNQTIPDVVQLVSLCNNMHTMSTMFKNQHTSIEAHWFHRFLTHTEEFRELVREPGFDVDRIKAVGLVILSCDNGHQVHDMQQFRNEIVGVEPIAMTGRNYIAEQASSEFKVLQEGEEFDPQIAALTTKVLPCTPSEQALQRAVEALHVKTEKQKTANKLAQNQRKRAAQKLKKKAKPSIHAHVEASQDPHVNEDDEKSPGNTM